MRRINATLNVLSFCIAAVAVPSAVALVIMAHRDRRALERSGLNGRLRVMANAHVRRSHIMLGIHAAYFVRACFLIFLPEQNGREKCISWIGITGRVLVKAIQIATLGLAWSDLVTRRRIMAMRVPFAWFGEGE